MVKMATTMKYQKQNKINDRRQNKERKQPKWHDKEMVETIVTTTH